MESKKKHLLPKHRNSTWSISIAANSKCALFTFIVGTNGAINLQIIA